MPYFDHASTSFPKPAALLERMQSYLTDFGVSPGRGAYHLSQKAEELVEAAREKLAALLNVATSTHVAFTMNATHGLNIVLKGYLKQNDHVLICTYSHNAALRPLERAKREKGVEYDVIGIDMMGRVDLAAIAKAIRPNTSLFIATGASNVIGVKARLQEAFQLCQAANIKILCDVTQSLGYQELQGDFVVGTGHKTLLGPSGIGFLYVKDSSLLPPLIEGGSHGNNSMTLEHPEKMPYKFEAGTMNSVGIAGLLGSLEYIHDTGFEAISKKAMRSTEIVWKELAALDSIVLYGTDQMHLKIPIISFNIKKMIPGQVARELDEKYGICTRAGLHCAPLLHKSLGTLPTGTVRISIGHQNSDEEVLALINAVKDIATK